MKEKVTLSNKEVYMGFAEIVGGPQKQQAEILQFVGSCENIIINMEIRDPKYFHKFDFCKEYEVEIK